MRKIIALTVLLVFVLLLFILLSNQEHSPRHGESTPATDTVETENYQYFASDNFPILNNPNNTASNDTEETDPTTSANPSRTRTYTFSSEEELLAFLLDAKAKGYRIGPIIRELNTVRIGLGSNNDWSTLKGGAPNLPVSTPTPPEGISVGEYTAVGDQLANILGISQNDPNAGKGVRIAILDTKVASHVALNNSPIAIFDYTGAGASGHGTAVASLIAGNDPLIPGLAQGAQIANYAVLDPQGQTDAFTLAAAIVDATNRGTQILNLSLGSSGHSPVLEQAVNYALARGVAVVAAAGNEGAAQVSYPAAYPGVIGVGATDAARWHTDFSNTGEAIDISAPGYAVNAAWVDGQYVEFTGTSAAVPVVSAAIARVVADNQGMSPQQAAQLLIDNADEAGLPGADVQYGAGTLNLDRVENRFNTSFTDYAVSGYYEGTDGNYYAIVQNRGNASSQPNSLTIQTNDVRTTAWLSPMRSGDIATVEIPNLPALLESDNGEILLQLTLSQNDDNIRNNELNLLLSQEDE